MYKVLSKNFIYYTKLTACNFFNQDELTIRLADPNAITNTPNAHYYKVRKQRVGGGGPLGNEDKSSNVQGRRWERGDHFL